MQQMQTTTNNCPLGDHLQKYWARLSEPERRMQLDEQALYSLTPQVLGSELAQRLPGKTVVDMLCGAGGDAIAFARNGKSVTAIEQDPARLRMAEFNASIFRIGSGIKFVQGDALEVVQGLKAEAVYLDPPWGGPDYWKKEAFTLSNFNPDGELLIAAAFQAAPTVLIKLPKNFDMGEFERIGVDAQVAEHSINGALCFRSALLHRK